MSITVQSMDMGGMAASGALRCTHLKHDYGSNLARGTLVVMTASAGRTPYCLLRLRGGGVLGVRQPDLHHQLVGDRFEH